MGMGVRPVEPGYILVSWIYALAPAILLPLKLERPSQVFLYIQYFIFFVPLMFCSYHITTPMLPHKEVFQLVTMAFLCMCIMTIAWTVSPRKVKPIPLRSGSYWFVFSFLALGFIAILLITYRNNLKLVSFDDVYELREAAGEVKEGSIFGSKATAYALTWVQGCFAPIAFAVALYKRSRLGACMASLPFLLIYMIQGSKIALMAPIFTFGIYLWATKLSRHSFVSFALALAALLSVPYLLEGSSLQDLNTPYLLLVNSRTFAIPQMVSVQFYDFFQRHAPTLGAHIPGIDMLVPNRFPGGLPYEIGWYYFDRPVGANVGVWAGDGIASFGLIGMPIFTIGVVWLFRVIDAITAHLKVGFVVVALSYLASIFPNVQLNVVIGTNGLFLALLCLLHLPRRGLTKQLWKEADSV